MSEHDTDDGCREAWRTIKDREFHAWDGVPAACDYADFDDAFERLRDERGGGTLGGAKRRAHFRMHVADGFPEPLQVWFRDDRLLLIEIPHPALPYPVEDLLDRLGEPDARWDYDFDVMTVDGGAWIYPSRGLALFLDPAHETVVRISLFRSCSLDEYAETLQRDTGVEEFPPE